MRVAANGIWGRVEWTAQAAKLIGSKEYRYLSPVILYNEMTKAVARVKGAGLVHNPNFHLTALAAQEDTMTPDQLRTTAPATDQTPTFMVRLAAMLKLAPDATADEIITAMEKLMTKADTPDPSKFVPVEAMAELLAERNAKVATMSEQRAAVKVAEAMRGGYLTPAMKPWALALCAQDEASFDQFIAKAVPAYQHLTVATMSSRPPAFANATTVTRTDDAAKVCAQLGLPPGSLD